jgi:lysophospholipase L1-like esterase
MPENIPVNSHHRFRPCWTVALLSASLLFVARGLPAQTLETAAKPATPSLAKFNPRKAPAVNGCLLRAGDRLAICGDSITEQKIYSRIMETYLTVCVPQLKIAVRQHGWSGETAERFLQRMTADCLRFKPTVATTCYGMNDYRYRPYDEANARWYCENYTGVVRAFKAAGVRVVLGSPGCVGKVASWVKTAAGTVEEHNLHLCKLRDIDIEIAAREDVRFADVFWPLFANSFVARQKYGADYALAGHDGVHPQGAGHLVMAYAFLKALGLDGEVGTLSVDLEKGCAAASEGHQVDSFRDGVLTVTSRRYPFCAAGEANQDNSMRSGMTLVPFNAELNRYRLVVRGGTAKRYRVTWGDSAKSYSVGQLAQGVNLADDFAENPFSAAFKKVDEAVAAKQAFETKQMKSVLHAKDKEGLETAVAKSEAEHAALAAAVQAHFVPVSHTIIIQPQNPDGP